MRIAPPLAAPEPPSFSRWATRIRAHQSADGLFVRYEGEIPSDGLPLLEPGRWRALAVDFLLASTPRRLLRFAARYGPFHAPEGTQVVRVLDEDRPRHRAQERLLAAESFEDLRREQEVFQRLSILLDLLRRRGSPGDLARLLTRITDLWRDPGPGNRLTLHDPILRAWASWVADYTRTDSERAIYSAEKNAHAVVGRVLSKFPTRLHAYRAPDTTWTVVEAPRFDPLVGVRPLVYHGLRMEYVGTVAPLDSHPCPRCGCAVIGRRGKVWCDDCSERGRSARYYARKLGQPERR